MQQLPGIYSRSCVFVKTAGDDLLLTHLMAEGHVPAFYRCAQHPWVHVYAINMFDVLVLMKQTNVVSAFIGDDALGIAELSC